MNNPPPNPQTEAPVNVQEFLDHLASEADTPAALAALDSTALSELHQAAQDEFATLYESGDLTSATIDAMEALAAANDVLTAEQDRRDAEAAQAAEKVAQLAQRMGRPTGGDDDGADSGDGAPPADPDDGTTTPPTDPRATQPGDGDGDGDGGGTDPAPTPTDPARELVNASAKKVNLSALRQTAPTPRLPRAGRVSITAGADVPGVPTGRALDMDSLVAATEARFKGFPQGKRIGSVLRGGIASIARPFPAELQQGRDGGDDNALLAAAADQSRLPQGSLLAAGGWCAPSETLYDLCEPETTDGLLSVPEIQIRRGGIRYAESPAFSDIYSGVGFVQTEAQNIAAVAKDCYEIGCPSFSEVRLDAYGLCITAGILQERGYPEMVQRVLRGAMTAHAHKMNAATITKMVALATPVTAGLAGFGAWADTLSALELQVEDTKYKFRLGRGATLEGVAPAWLRPILRADLAVRNGDSSLLNVTDAQLNAHFASRGVAMQWVVDWQDAYVNAGNAGMGGAAAATAWPTTADLLLYPAGTFVRGAADVIELSGIYDSSNILTNSYTALFTEEAMLVARRCLQARIVTLPELCPSGRTGAQVAYDCTP